jgi:hypothetical protein
LGVSTQIGACPDVRAPYTVAAHQVDEYQRLEAGKNQALAVGDIAAHDAVEARQGQFERFTPIMSHSLFEAGSKKVVFHVQLLADFRTVDEMGRRMLAELDVLRRPPGVP